MCLAELKFRGVEGIGDFRDKIMHTCHEQYGANNIVLNGLRLNVYSSTKERKYKQVCKQAL